jgi:putative tryptophan/tyrosine transport system substrate-binding protein
MRQRLARRAFIPLIAAAAAWPLAARARQPAMPVIGVLGTRAPGADPHLLTALHRGLKEAGFVDGQNLRIDYRFAENQYDRLPTLAADLVGRRVALIVSMGTPAAPAAKAATATIPVVFGVGDDPVQLGLIASLARPGGNLTGITTLSGELGSKRLELLRELVPTATLVGVLVNPTNVNAEAVLKDLQAAARAMGLQIHLLWASTEHEIEAAFATLLEARAGGLMVGTDPFFNSRSEQLAQLALRHAVPTVYQFREFAAAGGLMSYGGSITEVYRLAGIYVGRILKGEKPGDLPVHQSTKVELIINLRTAKVLGLEVPPTLLARADEVIE